MDALAHLRSARERVAAARRLLLIAFEEIEAAETMTRHMVDQWTADVRTPVEAVLPSQLPDRTLGPALRRVRDFLCRAPGQPVDPEFDRVVGIIGLEGAQALAGSASEASADALWRALVDYASRRRPTADPGMERAE